MINFNSGVYRFSIRGDDGLRVFVDDNVVIDQWHLAASVPPTYTADINLLAGAHAIRVEYYQATGLAYVTFTYGLAP